MRVGVAVCTTPVKRVVCFAVVQQLLCQHQSRVGMGWRGGVNAATTGAAVMQPLGHHAECSCTLMKDTNMPILCTGGGDAPPADVRLSVPVALQSHGVRLQ
jgi:hypothetical protein